MAYNRVMKPREMQYLLSVSELMIPARKMGVNKKFLQKTMLSVCEQRASLCIARDVRLRGASNDA